MNAVLKLILQGEALDASKLADLLAVPQAEIDRQLAALKRDGVLLGWRPVLNPDFEADSSVRAHIEVRVRPEGGLGFDRLAERIAQFEQVETCYLMSGGFDLLVIVKDSNLRKVAAFVHDRLAKLDGVQSTATSFMLRAYKEQGHIITVTRPASDQPSVSP